MPDPIVLPFFTLAFIAALLLMVVNDLRKSIHADDKPSIQVDIGFIVFYVILVIANVCMILTF